MLENNSVISSNNYNINITLIILFGYKLLFCKKKKKKPLYLCFFAFFSPTKMFYSIECMTYR